ncbi:MAG: DUF115 domain-containing protein [Balneolaceae bacterium]|nr:DUF115 domain-containing protein [Balneolaceae bacterium]
MKYFIQLKTLFKYFSITKSIGLFSKISFFWLADFGLPLRKNERKIKSFKNLHKNERCFIIGNGPSLNKLDLKKLKNEYTFGVNAIYTYYDKMQFFPSYYIVEDTFVAEDRSDEINNYKESEKFYGNYLTYCLKPDEKTTLLNVIFDYRNYPDFPRFSTNALREINVGGTVTYLCLQMAYYMGFKEVYLIGFDHSYKIPKSAKIEGNDITSTTDDVNHFSKEYFGKGKRWHDPRTDRMELAYIKANKYFDIDGRKVFNATAGGQLEVFERVEYDSLF